MICFKCGREIAPAQAKYCAECGAAYCKNCVGSLCDACHSELKYYS